MINYLRLLRVPNLLMIPLTMYLLRYGIIEPALTYGYSIGLQATISLQFTDRLFLIVVLINVFLGAAGYVINDYFDRKIDAINRPNQVIIGKKIHRRTAIILHSALNGIALLLAGYLSYKMRKPSVFIVYAMLSGIFWLYSTTYKKQLLIGNFIVAFLTALVPLQVAYFDIIPLNTYYSDMLIYAGADFKSLLYWIAGFAVYAFVLNFIREIIKDIEDFEGDKNYDCTTLPITIGTQWSKLIVITLITVVLSSVVYLYFRFLFDPFSKWYLLIAVCLPIIISIFLLIKANKPKNYHTISTLIKFIMLFGICYAFIARQVMIFNFTF